MAKRFKKARDIIIGILVFALIYLLLPSEIFGTGARTALAMISLMVCWWITRPVPIAVTSLLPIAIVSISGIVPVGDVLADYFSQIVVLLLGAYFIITAWTRSGLDRRIALRALLLIGTSVRKQLVVWFALSTVMSMFLPNAVVAATLCPIAASMICFSDQQKQSDSKALFLIMLAIVWGAGIGGMGTPLGGAMNLVAINHIETLTGTEYMFITWVQNMMPYLLIVALGTCVWLMTVRLSEKSLSGSREYFIDEYKKLGKMRNTETISLLLFAAAVLLAFLRPLYQNILPAFSPYYAFLLMGLVVFLLKDEKGESLVTWQHASAGVNWGMIILFSGGLAAGNLIVDTGAAAAVAGWAASLDIKGIVPLVLLIVILGMFLANASSNTAATAVLVPITIGITGALGLTQLPFVYVAAAACNCAFVLPTSIRAIPVGYGLDVEFMFRKGLVAVVISLVLLVIGAIAILSI